MAVCLFVCLFMQYYWLDLHEKKKNKTDDGSWFKLDPIKSCESSGLPSGYNKN